MSAPLKSPTSGAIVQLQRDSQGRILPGSGGRPAGSKNRVSNEALAAVRNMKDEAIAQLQTRLQAGDWNALQFVLEKILPRGRLIEINAASPSAVTDALANGLLTSEEAKNIATVLEKLASIEEINELRQRLEKLERIANEK